MSCDLSILSIEPNVRDAKRLKHCLAGVDDYCIAFRRAADAIVMLERLAQVKADVLFIDYDLPAATGLEVIRRLRSAGDLRPVVATTANDCGYLAAQLIRAGADGYLAKSDLTCAFVSEVLRQCIGRGRERALEVQFQRQAVRGLLRRQRKLAGVC